MFFSKQVRIVVKNLNRTIEVKSGTNLYKALLQENIISPTLCDGSGQCGKCKLLVIPSPSERKKDPIKAHPLKPKRKETFMLARMSLDMGYRLACYHTVDRDLVVDTTEITAPAETPDMGIRIIERPQAAEPVKAPEPKTQAAPQPPPHQPHQPAPSSAGFPNPFRRTEKAPAKNVALNGLLLLEQGGKLNYFHYSVDGDATLQEGWVENVMEFKSALKGALLADYIYNVLKIKDIERVIYLTDETEESAGFVENFFNLVTYTPSDSGSLQCEVVRPVKHAEELSVFLRFLAVKGKKRLMIPLDRLDRSYYFKDNSVVKIPLYDANIHVNMLNIVLRGENPIVDISEDLRKDTRIQPFRSPDSLTLPVLMKVAACMVRLRLADTEFRIVQRRMLDAAVPLEYVVKVTDYQNAPAYYLFRDKETSLLIPQEFLTKLAQAKKFAHKAIEYTESNLGNIENIVFTSPAAQTDLLKGMAELGLVPKRHENNISYNASSATATALFLEPDIRTYVQKYFGSYETPSYK